MLGAGAGWLAALVVLTGCGSSTGAQLGHGPLRWSATPFVSYNPRLPHDRVVLGKIHNTSQRMLTLDARRIVVRDGTGRRLASDARFTNSYGHSIYGAFQQPPYVDPVELTRLGIVIDLVAGDTVPLFVGYRLAPSSKPPITATFAAGGRPLPLPIGHE